MKEIDFLKALLEDLENQETIIKSRIKLLSENEKKAIEHTKYSNKDLIKENSNLDWDY